MGKASWRRGLPTEITFCRERAYHSRQKIVRKKHRGKKEPDDLLRWAVIHKICAKNPK
jgi:hypothetical protein